MQTIRTCFIIDDDPADRDILLDTLKDINPAIQAYTASDGEYALTMLHSWQPEKPDLIFIDLNMPRMGGKSLIQHIKKHAEFSSIPVAVYTTSSRQEERDELLKMGVDWFITKPNTLAELKITISLVLTEDVPLS